MKNGDAQLVMEHMDDVLAKFAESVAPTIQSVKNIEEKIGNIELATDRVTTIEAAVKDISIDLRDTKQRVSQLEAV